MVSVQQVQMWTHDCVQQPIAMQQIIDDILEVLQLQCLDMFETSMMDKTAKSSRVLLTVLVVLYLN